MAPEEKKISDLNSQALKNVGKDSEDIKDITGDNGCFITASTSRKKYELRPCSLKDLPILAKHLNRVDEILKKGLEEGKTEFQLITDPESGMLDTMASVIHMAIRAAQPSMTPEDVKGEFSLSDFPKAYEAALNLNDFLAGMKKIMNIQ